MTFVNKDKVREVGKNPFVVAGIIVLALIGAFTFGAKEEGADGKTLKDSQKVETVSDVNLAIENWVKENPEAIFES